METKSKTWTEDDTQRILREAMAREPERARRRLWIDEANRICHDGPNPLPEVVEVISGLTVTGQLGGFSLFIGTPVPVVFGRLVAVHVRNGWRIDSQTATEAALSRPARG